MTTKVLRNCTRTDSGLLSAYSQTTGFDRTLCALNVAVLGFLSKLSGLSGVPIVVMLLDWGTRRDKLQNKGQRTQIWPGRCKSRVSQTVSSGIGVA
jgi:hypothetical protein